MRSDDNSRGTLLNRYPTLLMPPDTLRVRTVFALSLPWIPNDSTFFGPGG